jgi:hypothetical protein
MDTSDREKEDETRDLFSLLQSPSARHVISKLS